MNFKITKPEALVSGAFVLVLAGILTYFIITDKPAETVISLSDASSTSSINAASSAAATMQVTAEPKIQPTISVYVVGSVVNPGVYTLNKGRLIFDAISAAGGLTAGADPLSVNMAYVLDKNAMIYIKAAGQRTSVAIGPDSVVSDGIGVLTDPATVSNANGIATVNINKAGAEALGTLPGVGPATAADIISYRETAGDFGKIEDIMKVSGIKDSKFQKIKDYICVD